MQSKESRNDEEFIQQFPPPPGHTHNDTPPTSTITSSSPSSHPPPPPRPPAPTNTLFPDDYGFLPRPPPPPADNSTTTTTTTTSSSSSYSPPSSTRFQREHYALPTHTTVIISFCFSLFLGGSALDFILILFIYSVNMSFYGTLILCSHFQIEWNPPFPLAKFSSPFHKLWASFDNSISLLSPTRYMTKLQTVRWPGQNQTTYVFFSFFLCHPNTLKTHA